MDLATNIHENLMTYSDMRFHYSDEKKNIGNLFIVFVFIRVYVYSWPIAEFRYKYNPHAWTAVSNILDNF